MSLEMRTGCERCGAALTDEGLAFATTNAPSVRAVRLRWTSSVRIAVASWWRDPDADPRDLCKREVTIRPASR
jgi:hypothetical protein